MPPLISSRTAPAPASSSQRRASSDYTSGRVVTLCPNNPLGAKGIGESGAVGAPAAVINAVVDALRGFGVEHIDMPATPEKVWQLMQGGTP